MAKKSILMVFTRVPFPLRAHGISVRYLPIIEYLAGRHEIDMILIVSDQEEHRRAESLRPYCRKLTILPDPGRSSHSLSIKCLSYGRFLLPWCPPMSFLSHSADTVTTGIEEATNGARYDSVVWVGSYLLPNLLEATPLLAAERVFVDFIDSPSLLARRKQGRILGIGVLDRYERWKIRRWERNVCRQVSGAIYISEVDAREVPPAPLQNAPKWILPNGISTCGYRSDRNAAIRSPNLGFLGNMSYPPNVEAVTWLYREVFTPMRSTRPDLSLVIIGRSPAPPILGLGEKPGVIVTGTVEDIWAYVNSVDVFVFPIWTGAGLKNKILEAMYARRPVVTTEIGNEGIHATSGKDLMIARRPEEFREAVHRLLGASAERARLGEAGHRYVVERFALERVTRQFESVLLGEENAVA